MLSMMDDWNPSRQPGPSEGRFEMPGSAAEESALPFVTCKSAADHVDVSDCSRPAVQVSSSLATDAGI